MLSNMCVFGQSPKRKEERVKKKTFPPPIHIGIQVTKPELKRPRNLEVEVTSFQLLETSVYLV